MPTTTISPALAFDSADGDHVQTTYPADFGTGAFTVGGWVRVESSPSTLVSTYDGTGVILRVSGGDYQLWTTNGETVTDGAAALGEWHHLVGARADNGDLTLWVDGEVVVTGASADSDVTNTNDLRIGQDVSGHRPLDGAADDVRAFGRRLSTSEIEAWMADDAVGDEAGWWPMDDYGADALADESGSGNDGTINGATWTLRGGEGRWVSRLETRQGDGCWVADELLSLSIEPEHSAVWDASIDIAPVIDPATYRFGTFDLYREGNVRLRCAIESADMADDGTITITGRERQGLALVDEEIEVEYGRMRTPDAIRDFWQNHTPHTANVMTPPGVLSGDTTVGGETVIDARTPADFESALQARTRDEQGRYQEEQDGSAPNVDPSLPLQLTDRGVELRQSCWNIDGVDYTNRGNDVDKPGDSTASNGTVAVLNGDGATIEFDISVGYNAPALAIVPRWRVGTGASSPPVGEVEIGIGSETVKTANTRNVVHMDSDWGDPFRERSEYRWAQTGGEYLFVHGDEVSGDTTVSITKTGGDNVYIDRVAILDPRFGYDFSFALDGEQQMDGPQTYPDSVPVRVGPLQPGIDIDRVDIYAQYDTGTQYGSVAAEIDGTTIERTQTTAGQRHHFETDHRAPRVVPLPHLTRAGDRSGSTPKRGYKSQVLERLDIEVGGDAVSVITAEQMSFSGTPLSILQDLHDHAGYHFALDHGRSDGELRAESFVRGDERLVQNIDDVVVTSRERSEETENYKNRVTVVGADYPPGIRREDDDRRYAATVEDEAEIDANGVHAITINDSNIESHGDARARARTELRKRLREDTQGGSIDSTPAMLRPGYPYLVPELGRDETPPDCPTLGDVASGETVTVGDGEERCVLTDITIDGTLDIQSGGLVTVTRTGSITVADGGTLSVADNGTLTAADDDRPRMTCESWSYSESPGDASASGDFGRLGGLGGRSAGERMLGLLTGAASAD